MALPNPIPTVQGSRAVVGPGIWQDTYVIAPGTSDYTTNGYVITALALRMNPTYGIQTAWISGANATAIAGWVAVPVFAIAQFGGTAGGSGFEGFSQLLLYFYVVTTGAQVCSGARLSGNIWL